MWRVLMLVLLVALALAPSAYSQDGVFEEGACPFPEIPDVRCGYLYVPEDRTNPDSPELELAVAIIAASNGNPLPDPVIYLEGGPGGAVLFSVEDFLSHPLRENRDLILIDQRGVGFSLPSLNCYEAEEGESDDPTGDCYQRLLDEGINLNAYNSRENAADINALRVALGYEQVNLWGISYGTRLALTVIRDFPEGLRAVAIDSVYPPEIDGFVQGSTVDAAGAFDTLFNSCASDAVCSTAYPTLRDDFFMMVDNFNNNPPVFMYFDGEEEYELELYGDDLLEAIFQTLYDTPAIPMLPYGINLLVNAQNDDDFTNGYDILLGDYTPESWNSEGDFEEFESVMDADEVQEFLEEFGDVTDSEGMFFSVECAEEFPFNNFDEGYELAETLPEALQEWSMMSLDGAQYDCETWQVAAADAIETERVMSDVPTLVMSGRFDPVTPPSYGDSAAAGLSNSVHVVVPNGGHGPSGEPGCAANVVKAYFDDPAASLDLSCVDALAVGWYTE